MNKLKHSKNYALFNKYLSKITKATISQFGSLENIMTFLHELCVTRHIGLAAKKISLNSLFISPLLLHKVIHSDRNLGKCVSLAQEYAAEMAEAVLYDRAINGYEEVTYDELGVCISRKKKYCSKSLLEYLKANSVKYQNIGKNGNSSENKKHDNNKVKPLSDIGMFEVEAYELDNAAQAE